MNAAFARWKPMAVIAIGLLLLSPAASLAGPTLTVTGSGTIGDKAVSAEATFEIVDASTLTIVLKNTATTTKVNAVVLTDVDFNWSGVTFTATGSSVTVGSGSTWFFPSNAGSSGAGTDVSAEWALQTALTLTGGGTYQFGVSATALANPSATSTSTILGSPDLGGSNGLNGADFGLAAPGSHLNVPIKNSDIIETSVLITLKVSGGTLDFGNLGTVAFSYGSLQAELLSNRVVPEPASIGLALLGLGALGLRRLRTRKWAV